MAEIPTFPIKVIAQLCDITPRHLRRLASDGHITHPGARQRWPITTVTEYIQYLRSQSLKSDAHSDQRTAAARLKKAQADRAEMDNALRAGQLLDFDEVAREVSNMIHAAKARLMQIPVEAAGHLENRDRKTIRTELERSIREACDELAEDYPEGVEDASALNGKRVGGSKPEA